MRDILGEDYDPLHVLAGRDNEGKFTFNKNVDVPKNHLSLAYLLHAYGVSQSTFKRLRQRGGESLPKQVSHNQGKSVVTAKDYASTVYTEILDNSLPELDAMVKPGGPCEGAVVVHQEDNAGLHIDKVYKQWLQEQFDLRGWKLEHQAPQGPYTNALDLQMFPAMSKRHSELLQMYSNNEANAETIWRVACLMVSRAFIHAYRIMQKIIENDGHNHWLVDGRSWDTTLQHQTRLH